MSKQPPPKPAQVTAPLAKIKEEPVPPTPLDLELPTGIALELVKVPRQGHCVLLLHLIGDRIVSKEILSGPEPRALANERLKLELVRRILPAVLD